MGGKKIRVLLVEDSLVVQTFLSSLITTDSRFELVAIAKDGKQAAEFVRKFAPDVVSMDINMPVMDGIESTKYIMENSPLPIVVVSSFYEPSEIELAMKVLDAGAVTILQKPFGPGHSKYEQTTRTYLNTLKLMSEIKVVRRKAKTTVKAPAPVAQAPVVMPKRSAQSYSFKVVAIGASAGGPESVRILLSGLPADLSVPVLLVQHIDSNFAEGFVAWLNSSSNLPVHMVTSDMEMLPGHVYMPSGERHLIVKANNIVSVQMADSRNGVVPSVNKLFKSVAEVYGKYAIAVLLSGMGRDGASEMKTLYDQGAYTIAQDEATSLIYGMPGEAVRLGGVKQVLSPVNIINQIVSLVEKR